MSSEKAKKITYNTAFLYLRMLVLLGTNLYTSRIILKALGISDFGIYNTVAGVVVLFSFINFTLVRATQRFISYELGRKGSVTKVFNTALLTHASVAILMIALAETVGLYILHNHLNLPPNRFGTALFAYHLAIGTAAIQILNSPFNATIISNEKMRFYSRLCIIEVIMKLASAACLLYVRNIDRLGLYSILILLSAFITLSLAAHYATRHCKGTKIKFEWDKKTFIELFSFSGWSLLGGLGNMGAQQSINILLNIYFGVMLNAALGVTNQVTNAIYSFVSNFQTAYEPQIVKSQASGDYKFRNKLINTSTRSSAFLFMMLMLPICLNIDFILQLWLHIVPSYTDSFIILMLCFLLIDAISAPLWITAQAIGDIKHYQTIMSVLLLMNIPFMWVLLHFNAPPQSVFYVRITINLLSHVYRIYYLKRKIIFSIRTYIRTAIAQLFMVILAVAPVFSILLILQQNSWLYLFISSLIIELVLLISIWNFGMNKEEREWILIIIKNKFNHA